MTFVFTTMSVLETLLPSVALLMANRRMTNSTRDCRYISRGLARYELYCQTSAAIRPDVRVCSRFGMAIEVSTWMIAENIIVLTCMRSLTRCALQHDTFRTVHIVENQSRKSGIQDRIVMLYLVDSCMRRSSHKDRSHSTT
jgi:hypothetical protein